MNTCLNDFNNICPGLGEHGWYYFLQTLLITLVISSLVVGFLTSLYLLANFTDRKKGAKEITRP